LSSPLSTNLPLASPDGWRQWYSNTIKLWREYNMVPDIDESEKIKPTAIRRRMLKLMMPIFPDLVSQADEPYLLGTTPRPMIR
jgi:hypothetical protein